MKRVSTLLRQMKQLLQNYFSSSGVTSPVAKIRSRCRGKLVIDPFSEKLIREAEIPYVLLPETGEDFFAETIPSDDMLEQTQKLVIYRWNRHYPADVRWDPDLDALGFVLRETTDFPGTSHEKITREVYERC